jgi:hypothetical protein
MTEPTTDAAARRRAKVREAHRRRMQDPAYREKMRLHAKAGRERKGDAYAAYLRERRARLKDKINEQIRDWYKRRSPEQIEKRRATEREWIAKNPDKVRETRARYNKTDKARAKAARWTERNKDVIAARSAKRRDSDEWRAWWKQHYEGKRDYFKQKGRERMGTPEGMCTSSLARAKQKRVAHTITESDIVVHKHCPCCGVEMIPAVGQRRLQSNSPSLDRILPERGYVPGNVVVMCARCNLLKGAMTLDQARFFVDLMEQAHERLRNEPVLGPPTPKTRSQALREAFARKRMSQIALADES